MDTIVFNVEGHALNFIGTEHIHPLIQGWSYPNLLLGPHGIAPFTRILLLSITYDEPCVFMGPPWSYPALYPKYYNEELSGLICLWE